MGISCIYDHLSHQAFKSPAFFIEIKALAILIEAGLQVLIRCLFQLFNTWEFYRSKLETEL
jgi:hypothetical protein